MQWIMMPVVQCLLRAALVACGMQSRVGTH
jgi:hypothetical protein